MGEPYSLVTQDSFSRCQTARLCDSKSRGLLAVSNNDDHKEKHAGQEIKIRRIHALLTQTYCSISVVPIVKNEDYESQIAPHHTCWQHCGHG